MSDTDENQPAIPLPVLYCRCAYAKVVPEDVKNRVLQDLCASGQAFDTVADLCEMSARRDPALGPIASGACEGGVKIVACYERAVRGLFRAAGHDLPGEGVTVLNMRELDAESVASRLQHEPEVNEASS
ncbi:MAG: hypothetical protein ACYTGQ_18785 [Planctomycetota bacterium]|jgi:hypothetical protein